MSTDDWRKLALCMGDDPTEWDRETDRARNICNTLCPVRAQCYTDAMLPASEGGVQEHGGMRGGTTGLERARTLGIAPKEAPASKRAAQAATHAERLRLIGEGATDTVIAAATGGSKYSVRRWRLRNDIPPNHNTLQTPQAEATRTELYWQGLTDAEIAGRMDCSARFVGRWRKAKGLPSQGTKARDKERAELYARGLPDVKIARHMGTSVDVVRRWRVRSELPPLGKVGRPLKASA